MIRRRHWLWIGVLLYLVTWVGGWAAHSRSLRTDALAKWQEVADANRETMDRPADMGGSPDAWINWCVPILPGLLIADFEYTESPEYGGGGVDLILFYGIGTKVLYRFSAWVA